MLLDALENLIIKERNDCVMLTFQGKTRNFPQQRLKRYTDHPSTARLSATRCYNLFGAGGATVYQTSLAYEEKR